MLPILGIAILVLTFQGWGALFLKKFKIDLCEREWILRTTLGMAVVMGIGSFQMALSLPFIPVSALIILVGLFFSFKPSLSSYQSWAEKLPKSNHIVLGLQAFLWFSVSYKAALSLWSYSFNCFDDYLAYFTHAKMILQTNQALDPFSLRRMASFGGQSYLQALFLLFSKEENLLGIDGAIGLFLSAGLFLSFFKKYNRYQYILLFCTILFVWSDHPRINTASTMTGVALLLCLIRLWEPYFELNKKGNDASALGIAVLNSAFFSLRANYVLGLGVLYLFYLMQTGVKNKWFWKMVGWTALLIIPWMFHLYLSSGTPFFPLFKGNYSEKVSTFGYIPQAYWIFRMLKDVTYMTALWGLVGLGALSFYSKKRYLIWGSLYGYVAVLFVMVIFTLSVFDVKHAIRYSYPFFVATFLLCLTGVLEIKNKLLAKYLPVLILFCTFFFAEGIIGVQDTLVRKQYKNLANAKGLYYTESAFEMERGIFPKIVDSLKPQSKVLVAVDHPFLLDYRRNKVFNIDIPGDVSPAPGLPLDNIRAMDNYLKNIGIDQVLFLSTEKSRCEYNRKFWERQKRIKKKLPFFENWLPTHLGWIAYTDLITPMSKYLGDGYYLYDVPGKK